MKRTNLIYENKKKLKGSSISIKESFTPKRMKIIQKARDEHGFKKRLETRWKDNVLECSE